MEKLTKVNYLICHHTAGNANQTFADINAFHRDTRDPNGGFMYHYGYPSSLGSYIAYHFIINSKGELYQARQELERGYHTKGMNDQAIGICLIGSFDETYPTPEQTATLKALLLRLALKYGIAVDKIVPHRKFSSKSCFGRLLADNWASDLVKPQITQYTSLLTQLLEALQKLLSLKKLGIIKVEDKGCDY